MKKSFAAFWKRNLAFAKLGIVTNLEYRLNYVIDAFVQPLTTTGIEILLWLGVFAGSKSSTIMGFGKEYYLAYALWAAFFSRITTSWMYEYKMIEEISSGTVNSLIVRPMGFYEYYLFQFMGYKLGTSMISFILPIAAAYFFHLPTIFSRIPLALLLAVYYLLLVHTISFLVCCFAFHLTKISSFTVAKNLLMWILTGELFPLDLIPDPWKSTIINLPFSSATYLPVAYVTGRVDIGAVKHGFITITYTLIIFNLIGAWLWRKGLRVYSGTGA